MSQDYARKNLKKDLTEHKRILSQTRIVWFSTLSLIFIFAAGVFFLNHHERRQYSYLNNTPEAQSQPTALFKTNKTEFEFYDILTEAPAPSVLDLSEEAHTRVREAHVSQAYYLQVASFKNSEEANALRAQLTSAGYVPLLRQAQIDTFTWYRIFVGPYASRLKANQARAQLRHYQPLIMFGRPV